MKDSFSRNHRKSPSLRALNPGGAAGYILGQHQFFSQRGTLQSRNTPSVRAWIDPIADADHNQHPPITPVDTSSMSSIGFASGEEGGFPEFHVPSRIQEKQFGYS
ncbi:transcription factor TCP3-like [Henckelia pumila]|uniref:transcription factor TCP3-like n=1 Tax=Henckelia pumila TaxID=405737 RepID=UPI003C6EA1EF